MADSHPRIQGSKAQGPDIKTLTPGTTYAWCSCGQSENQPWCNGAHRGSDQQPVVFKAESEKPVALLQLQEDEESAILRRFSCQLKARILLQVAYNFVGRIIEVIDFDDGFCLVYEGPAVLA